MTTEEISAAARCGLSSSGNVQITHRLPNARTHLLVASTERVLTESIYTTEGPPSWKSSSVLGAEKNCRAARESLENDHPLVYHSIANLTSQATSDRSDGLGKLAMCWSARWCGRPLSPRKLSSGVYAHLFPLTHSAAGN